MLLGSPARAIVRILAYALLTLPLLPVQALGLVLGLRPLTRWLPVYYHRAVCAILSLRVEKRGRMSTRVPTLFVVNHVSYLDIEVLGSVIPGSFVAKQEVASWPFFSILAKLQRSVFIDRSIAATRDSHDDMLVRLNGGDNLILFPEGTSGDGTRVLPFRSALFAVAQLEFEGKPIVVQPVSLAYVRLDGIPLGRNWRPLYTWFGDMDMAGHLWEMTGLGEVDVIVNFHEPTDISRFGGNRKKLADHCFRVISEAVSACNSGRVESLPPPARRAA